MAAKRAADPARAARAKKAAQSLFRGRAFCVLPWTHLHVRVNGDAQPCCAWAGRPTGSLRSAPIQSLWNSRGMKRLRKNMLAGRPSAGCRACYELEGSKFKSMRLERNETLARHRARAALTAPDGSLPLLPFPFVDIRFSNLCNLRCRTCSAEQSSAWAREAKKLGWLAEGAEPLNRAYGDWDDLWRQLEPLLEKGLEEIVFAGGEPLLSREHYRILDFLLKKGLTRVYLRYVTNFSSLRFEGQDVLGLWSRFERVRVAASLDGSGRRGEYLRAGLDWGAAVKNREEMLRRCPQTEFNVSATLSLFNALHLPDFHRDWVEKGYIGRDDFFVNPLLSPPWYSAQVLPEDFKRRVQESYRRHRLEFLAETRRAAAEFEAAERFLAARDASRLLPDWAKVTRRLDALRGENCREAFPELSPLLEPAPCGRGSRA
ncbi:MAG: twitch domain-containing radical SAM protein [Elusimicrobia bacterium]|nr:twitch domain-containing radical SAM protein [Elusimicrobiota bacterium]